MSSDAQLLATAFALLAEGKLRESATLAEQLARRFPADAGVWHLLSRVYAEIRQPLAAVKCATQAVALRPTDPLLMTNLGQRLATIGNRCEALRLANAAARMATGDASTCDALGTLYAFCEESEKALVQFSRAVALRPDNTSYLYNLATAQRMNGQFVEAERGLDRVISANPLDTEALALRSSLRTQTIEQNHVKQLEDSLELAPKHSHAEVTLRFALAKELEDLGNYPASFAHLRRANVVHRALNAYDVAADVKAIDEIIRVQDERQVRSSPGFPTSEPISVFGLPRSGTTLVERILSSHTRVTAMGELPTFPFVLGNAIGRLDPQPVAAFAERALAVDPVQLGLSYVESTRPQTGHTPHFVDKLTTNYLNAGVIARALPQATLIGVARMPMDSCYALYKTAFVNAYEFSYDLVDLARYYAAWHALMTHWKHVLGERLLIVQYEDLVERQEEVTRRILAHRRLGWEPACLDFHRHRGPVSSASTVQVRQGLYASSVGKWRHYRQELEPLRDALDARRPRMGWRLGCTGDRVDTVRQDE